ncbi:MAG: four helix bundle protein [Alistipes sp.]|nr:four helix bundle protein [Alistipes sp.]
MREYNLIVDKTYSFALNIVKLCRSFAGEYNDKVLARQLLKSGTSIGANVHEAVRGQSKSDFIAKMSIALKESYETEYWLSLLKDSGYISVVEYTLLYKDNCDITNILSRIILSAKANCVQEK